MIWRTRSFQSGGKLRQQALQRNLKKERAESGLSRFTFPRRRSHPASGGSPDSRFVELTAFPTFVSGVLASSPRSQWRGRAGFSPASLLSLQIAPEAKCSL